MRFGLRRVDVVFVIFYCTLVLAVWLMFSWPPAASGGASSPWFFLALLGGLLSVYAMQRWFYRHDVAQTLDELGATLGSTDVIIVSDTGGTGREGV